MFAHLYTEGDRDNRAYAAGAGDPAGDRDDWDPHAAGATPPPRRRSERPHKLTKRKTSKETDIDAMIEVTKENLKVTNPDDALPVLASDDSEDSGDTDADSTDIDVGNGDLPDPTNKDKKKPRRKKKPARERERLTFCSILCNVVYNVILMVAMILSLASYYMYEWIESDKKSMVKSNIFVVDAAPGFNQVSCGLTTYCIDAAGSVSECSLPWPRYGSDDPDVFGDPEQMIYTPVFLWKIAAGLVLGATFCLCCAWIYTFFACFGCFRSRVQRFCNNLVVLAGTLLVSAVICFAASFEDLAVKKCMLPNVNATADSNPPCTAWFAELPSEMIEGKGNAHCRICPPAQGAFTISTSCTFGWGAKVAVAACLIAYISTYCGQRVTSRPRTRRRFSLRSFRSRSTVKNRNKSRIADPLDSTESLA